MQLLGAFPCTSMHAVTFYLRRRFEVRLARMYWSSHAAGLGDPGISPVRRWKFPRHPSYYHPMCHEIKDQEKLRRHPRCTVLWREHEFEPWTVFRKFPHYCQFFPGTGDRFEAVEETPRSKILSGDTTTYRSQDYLSPWNATSGMPLLREAHRLIPVYESFWERSVGVKPTDLAHVLAQIARWYSVGVKPLNLISEALNLLATQPSRKAIVLCMHYKASCMGLGIPSDEESLDHVESFLDAEGRTLRMTEMTTICHGFFNSDRRFYRPGVAGVVAKRFFQLLRTGHYVWGPSEHATLKQLSMNAYQDTEEMRLLDPALDVSGFFKFCTERTFHGLHDVHNLLRYLVSRSYHDESLLRRCAVIFKLAVGRVQFMEMRSKEVSRTFLYFALLDFKLDDDVLKSCVKYYRKLTVPMMRESFGISALQFLIAASLYDVYPLDVVDAFFASDLVRVEGRHLPGMKGGARMGDPWNELFGFHEILGIMQPDYAGARLSDSVAKFAQQRLKFPPPSKDDFSFASCLSEAISKRADKRGRFVAVERVLLSKPNHDLVVKLGRNNDPIRLRSRIEPRRRIALQLLGRHHYLADASGTQDWAVKPAVRLYFDCLTRLGYEVLVVGFRQRETRDDAALAEDIAAYILKT